MRAFNFKALTAATVKSSVQSAIEETRSALSKASSLESMDGTLTKV